MLTVGCHLSTSKGFAAMGRTALSLGANTFAFFTRNPRGGSAKAIDAADAAALRELMVEHDFGPLVAHAPYTLNPCSAKPEAREFARMCMADDLVRMEAVPHSYYNFHPGSHVKQGAEYGIELIAGLLNEVLASEQTTTVLLETMAGKGTEVGRTLEELAAIIERVELADHVGVCLDTCHVWVTISRATSMACWRNSIVWWGCRACAQCISTIRKTLAVRAKTATRKSAKASSALRHSSAS